MNATKRRTVRLLLMLALIYVTGCGRPEREVPVRWPTSPPEADGLELTVRAGEPWSYGSSIGRYFLVVYAPSGKAAWTCEVTSRTSAHRCDRTRRWFSGPGTYRVALLVQQGAARPEVASQTFSADGSELGVEVDLTFTADEVKKLPRPLELYVIRLLPSIPGVSLEPRWTPSADLDPGYLLVNQSAQVLYGVVLFGNYFGYVEQRTGATWTRVRRAGLCGTVRAGEPLTPGDATGSFEGFFIGRPEAFARGAYRYVVRYSTVAGHGRGIPSDIYDSGRTYAHSSDLHVVAASFEVR